MRNALLALGAAVVIGVGVYLGVGGSAVETAQSAQAETRVGETRVGDSGPAETKAPEIVLAQNSDAAASDAPTEAPDAEALAAKGYAVGDVILGDENAPVTIIEYASLTCPHCAAFHTEVLPGLKEKYIDTGKAKLILREFYFDQFGLWATAVARCGGASRYHAYLDVFFEKQKDWTRGDSQQAIVEEIRRIGRLGGLSPARVDECLSDQDFVTNLVQTYQEHAERDEVRSTPYFFINGEAVRGVHTVEEMSEVIDSKLDD